VVPGGRELVKLLGQAGRKESMLGILLPYLALLSGRSHGALPRMFRQCKKKAHKL
jgi:hypothetical protein